MVRVTVEDVWMVFGKVTALSGVSLEIEEGELVTLLGPSGCGKTTLLRIIAGLYRPTKGRVYFDGADITDRPPWERNVGLVFQDYALWPHMTVFDNIAYGLRLRKVPKEEIAERVNRVAELLRIQDLLDRYPHQLSGGQQQRVALARAIVINPSVLLLDEPLSNLDAKIRVNVRSEIRKLQKRLGITSIYVTHDQEEALSISDRIAVMNMGRIEQVGKPIEIYRDPASLFVADFIGQVNILPGQVKGREEGDKLVVETDIGTFKVSGVSNTTGGQVYVVFRPEHVEVSRKPFPADPDHLTAEGVVDTIQFLGNLVRLEVKVGDRVVKSEFHNPSKLGVLGVGERVYLRVAHEDVRLLRS
ncbi:ABC transporter ATP-binding protein [Infirmifilum sp. SLHALR2]|nr:MAG: spermidine/putrescine ABC transporter ATP-binding protein [Thermofilum sp. NZ13]